MKKHDQGSAAAGARRATGAAVGAGSARHETGLRLLRGEDLVAYRLRRPATICRVLQS